MSMLEQGLLGGIAGGSETYLDIREEERKEERDISKEGRAEKRDIVREGRAQDIWERRQERLNEYDIGAEGRKTEADTAADIRKSGLTEERKIGEEQRETAKEEKAASRIRSALAPKLVEAESDDEGEAIGPPQQVPTSTEEGAGLLTSQGYPDLAKSVRESKGKGAKISSDVSTANWLVEKGIAPDEQQAWNMLKSAASDPVNSVAKMADLLYPNAKEMYEGVPGYVSPVDRMANAEREVDRIRSKSLGKGAAPTPSATVKPTPPVEGAVQGKDKDGKLRWFVKTDAGYSLVKE